MASLETTEVYSYTEWSAALYKTDDGQEYQVTLTKSYSKDIGIEQEEVVNIEHCGDCVPDNDPIWEEVTRTLKHKKSPRRSSNSEQGHIST